MAQLRPACQNGPPCWQAGGPHNNPSAQAIIVKPLQRQLQVCAPTVLQGQIAMSEQHTCLCCCLMSPQVADPLRHFVDGLMSLTNPIGSVGDKVNVGVFR